MQETTTLPTEPGLGPFWLRYDVLLVGTLLVVLLAAALTVDVVWDGYGIKGDEATYTAMTLSAAYDRDLAFERKDLERYWAVYTSGPDGIFLKRGKLARLKIGASWPFVRFMRWGEAPLDRLYFGKAYIYPVLAAPFVWLLGMNGMLVFHLLLLTGVCALGYRFIAARSPKPVALGFVLAFLGASIVPVYGVWLTPEIFNLSFVFYAYFLWLYKEVAAPVASRGWLGRFVRGRGSDVLAVVLLGCVTFSKPLYILLVGPVLAWQLRRLGADGGWFTGWPGRLGRALLLSVIFGAVTGGLFAINAAVSGEFNYQGSDFAEGPVNRKVFYGVFPHEKPSVTFETAGFAMTTSQLEKGAVLDKEDIGFRYALNLGYFFFGRHAGLLPYFFPGLVALGLWWWRRREIRAWHVLALGAVVGTVVVTLAILPYTWSGGGGPPGNRYFMAVYPVLFFFLPPVRSVIVPLVAWFGGALFTAQLVLNAHHTARFPYMDLDHGAVRMLPIELTMVQDLPIRLDPYRAFNYGSSPQLELYLLDKAAYPPEPAGLWIAGERRADVIVRTTRKLTSMRLRLATVVPNRVWVSFAGQSTSFDLMPGKAMDVVVQSPEGVYSNHGYGYVLSVKPERGLVPKNVEEGTTDKRFLGVLVKMQGQVGQ